MIKSEPKEGARWFLILLCSFITFIVVWPAFYLIMKISYYVGSPIPVNLITGGLPASARPLQCPRAGGSERLFREPAPYCRRR